MKKEFYQRYLLLCNLHGLEPCSRRTASLLGTNRATISHWRTNCSMPKGEMIAKIADLFHVSSDYLIGRTEDPFDYTWKRTTEQEHSGTETASLQHLISLLDQEDLYKLEGVTRGLLLADKYEGLIGKTGR